MDRSYRWRSRELRQHQLFDNQLLTARKPGHRPLGTAELRSGRRSRVNETGATDHLIPPAVGVAVDHDVVSRRPLPSPVVQVVAHPDPPAPDRALDRRRVSWIVWRISIHDHKPPQPAKPGQNLLAAPVTRMPDLIDAGEFPGDVGQQRLQVETSLRIRDQTDLHRNRSVAGSRNRSRTRPPPETAPPRTRATGTRPSPPTPSPRPPTPSPTPPSPTHPSSSD